MHLCTVLARMVSSVKMPVWHLPLLRGARNRVNALANHRGGYVCCDAAAGWRSIVITTLQCTGGARRSKAGDMIKQNMG